MKACLVIALGLIVSGCVSSPVPPSVDAVAAEREAVVCKKERPTGSNRPVKVCRSVPGALEQEDTERDMRVLQRQSEMLKKKKK